MTSPEEIAEIIKKHYPDALILLFGSRAREEHLVDSDIDLIVVSSRFKNVEFIERPVSILRILYNEGVKKSLDILCYTPEEFRKKSQEIGIVREALKTGKILAE
ncbi:MAG: nucleotidyltransferase domain-containing protein [Candidatus Bathyarchaeota archaeon]|nr:nucleotidyltransferase domain-containing protein [Candidatus Bathyarchaeota archaeon]